MTSLSVGEVFAHYRIRALLGSGGMGEVYLAEDERLRRPVALKVLRPGEEGDDALERFLLEARAASALNHPNVAHIYDVGRVSNIPFIAMEYVEGETLERRLQSGPMTAAEAMELAVQLADALGDAFAKGIVHRDLKPSNIVINKRGQAKILDFGIARMAREDVPLSFADTAPNTVVGTVPYMSPEQARGKEVDHRSDIFTFGVILYEMVNGRRPFDGESLMDTIHRITSAEPAEMKAEVPEALRTIIARCLEKDRERRYETPEPLVQGLKREQESMQQTVAPPLPPRVATKWMVLAAAVVVSALVLVAVVVMRREAPVARKVVKLTSAAGLEDEPAVSPDGTRIAYTSDERGNLDVFVRPIAGGEAVRITDGDADDAQPAWSPDGKRIAFVSARDVGGRLSIVLGQALGNTVNARNGDLFVVPSTGGNAVKLVANAFYPSWSPDGKWIVFQSPRARMWDLWKIPSAGGQPVPLTRDLEFDYQPSWSPDGKSIVYGSGMPAPYKLKILRLDGGAPKTITDGTDGVLLRPAFTADGKAVIYSSTRGGSLNLWRLPLTTPASPPERLTVGEGDDVSAAVSPDGKRILYASVRQTPDVWSLDVESGKVEQLTSDTGIEEFPHRAPDGRVVFASNRGGEDAIWIRHPNGEMKLVTARSHAGQVRWSPDGKRIAFRFSDRGLTSIAVQEPGSAEHKIIAVRAEAPAWSPDGRQLAFTSWSGRSRAQIMVAPADGSSPPRTITSLALTTSYPTWSPNGKYLAFQATNDNGVRHIWIADVETLSAWPVTRGPFEDSHPQWSPLNPDQILFVRNHENLIALSIASGQQHPITRLNDPNLVLDYPSWSVDGKRIDFSLARKRGDLYMLEEE